MQECIGCINTFEILALYSSSYEVQKGLSIRYPECESSLSSFNNELTNLWSNYYLVKWSKLNEVKTNL